ncbi:MAG: hypothetical protein IKN04_12075 [Clostridia bacterium]|nr:hypothetical protein [Clostridia bacterium]
MGAGSWGSGVANPEGVEGCAQESEASPEGADGGSDSLAGADSQPHRG